MKYSVSHLTILTKVENSYLIVAQKDFYDMTLSTEKNMMVSFKYIQDSCLHMKCLATSLPLTQLSQMDFFYS